MTELISNLLWNTLLIFILSIVSVTDYRYFRIPNSCSFVIAVMGLVESISKHRSFMECVLGFMSINVVLIFIYVMTHKKGIGGGDIKLLSASGLLLGWQKNILAFFLASCGMILDQMILKNLLKKSTQKIRPFSKERVAFGPYLSIGIFISYFAGDQMINWYKNWPEI